MAAFSKGLRLFTPKTDYICSRCLPFSTTVTAQSGHSRWSKIKHDKAVVDGKKNVARSQMSREITLCSKLYGGDPSTNFKLAAILANAKKAGFPRDSMEKAIARGQGKSTEGAALESQSFEVMLSSSIAMIIETETDNRNRTNADMRVIIKRAGGVVSPTMFLFQKKGRLAFEQDERGLGVDDVLDEAIEAGAEDVETDEEGNIVVWTEPNMTTSAARQLQKNLDLKLLSSDIIWDANEDTKVSIEDELEVKKLTDFLEALQDSSDVQGVYANIVQGQLPDDVWDSIESGLDA